MASYLVFVPEQKSADAETFRRLGLGELVRDRGPDSAEISGDGPDGRPGCLCWFHNPRRPESNPEPVYQPRRQVWQPAKPNPELGLPADRFFLGMEARRPPTPGDLERPTRVRGRDVVLGDGNAWHVPVQRHLPEQVLVDEQGRLQTLPAEPYAEFAEAAERIFRWLVPEEGEPGIPLVEAWPVCALLLSLNYRANRDVCDWLGLLREELALKEMCKAVIEFDDILEIIRQRLEAEAQKKNSATPAG